MTSYYWLGACKERLNNKYSKQGNFHPVLLSLFYTCKRFRPYLNLPSCRCDNRDIICIIELSQSKIRTLTTRAKRAKIQRGEFVPVYSTEIFFSSRKLRVTLWTSYFKSCFSRYIYDENILFVQECAQCFLKNKNAWKQAGLC